MSTRSKWFIGAIFGLALVAGVLLLHAMTYSGCESAVIRSARSPAGTATAKITAQTCRQDVASGTMISIGRTGQNTDHSVRLSRDVLSASTDFRLNWQAENELTVFFPSDVAIDATPLLLQDVEIVFVEQKEATADSLRTLDDVKPAVAALLASTSDYAFLIISVAGSPDFVQMSGYMGTAELDFPQITRRQKQLRPKVEAVCAELGLELTIAPGSDGSEFLDYELPKSAAEIAAIVARILQDVFDAGSDAELEFTMHGFEPPTA